MANIVKLGFREREKQAVVNLKTLEGYEGELLACGFDSQGQPVFEDMVNAIVPTVVREQDDYGRWVTRTRNKPQRVPNPKVKYWLGGCVCGNADYTKAILIKKKYNCSDLMGQDIEDQVKNYMNSEGRLTCQSLYLYEQHKVWGMPLPYVSDRKVITTSEYPKLNWTPYQILLKSLGSDWRILTKRVKRIIKGLELSRLEAEREEL